MADENIHKPFDNDFIKDHVTDELHKTIVSELSTRKKSTKGSRKIKLTAEMLRQFLFYVSMGENLSTSAELVHMGEKTRRDYQARSDTFSAVSSLAQKNVSLRARMAVAKAIMGTKPGYYPITHPGTGKKTYIEIKATPPDTRAAMWWLEVVDKIGGEEGSDAPTLGAPRNQDEADLMESLLNKHYDYVQQKQKTKRSKS